MKNINISLAEKADIHDLYERSVQNVEHEIEFIQNTYQSLKRKRAFLYREDFCGTANSSCAWVDQGDTYYASGIDNDGAVLNWTENNRLSNLDNKTQKRIKV